MQYLQRLYWDVMWSCSPVKQKSSLDHNMVSLPLIWKYYASWSKGANRASDQCIRPYVWNIKVLADVCVLSAHCQNKLTVGGSRLVLCWLTWRSQARFCMALTQHLPWCLLLFNPSSSLTACHNARLELAVRKFELKAQL